MMHELLKHVLIGGAFIAAATLVSGAVNPWDDGVNAVLVEETYIVRPGIPSGASQKSTSRRIPRQGGISWNTRRVSTKTTRG